jgi:von Hippel-Lindau disease tumor supressor
MLYISRGLLLSLTLFMLLPSSIVLAQTKHVAEESGIRSVKGNESIKTSIAFINQSKKKIKIYWLNYQGKRVLYKALNSGENFDIQTYLTHPWLITDSEDNAKSLYFPDGQPRTINIR